jgi:hypothetical protein
MVGNGAPINFAVKIGRCFLWIILCSLAVPAWSAVPTNSKLASRVLRSGSALGDLDGDHNLDVANRRKTGLTEAVYSYQVDLKLGSKFFPPALTLCSKENAELNLEALDVDGDHDLDLVITARLTGNSVGVWINDGSGHFTKADPAQFGSFFQTHSGSLTSAESVPTGEVVSPPHHSRVVLADRRLGCADTISSETYVHPQIISLTWIVAESARFRAPPFHTASF